MAAKSADEGAKAIGRHVRTIRLGRALWQSAPLTPNITAGMRERLFDDGTFPPLVQVRRAVNKAKTLDQERPAPFAGKTKPFVHLSIINYGN